MRSSAWRRSAPRRRNSLAAPGRRAGSRSGLDVTLRRRLLGRKVEFDLGAVRLVEKELPDAAAGDAPQSVRDALALQGLDDPRQVVGAERYVIEHAGPLRGQRIAVEHMQDRGLVGIKPPARKLERRPRPHFEAQQIAVEMARLFKIIAQNREMIHVLHAHRALLTNAFRGATTNDAGKELGRRRGAVNRAAATAGAPPGPRPTRKRDSRGEGRQRRRPRRAISPRNGAGAAGTSGSPAESRSCERPATARR